MKNTLKIALWQTELLPGQTKIKSNELLNLLKNIDQDVDLLCLPEMLLGGFSYKKTDSLYSEWIEFLPDLRQNCKEKKVALSLTALERDPKNGKYYNTHYFLDKEGKISAKYRKIHLIGIGGFSETEYFSEGSSNELQCIDFEGWKIAPAICYDLRFPELFRRYFKQQADLVLLPAQWPLARKKHLEILSRARAVENQCYFSVCNLWGKQGKLEFNGESRIIDFQGDDIVKAHINKDELLIAELELETLRQYRKNFPVINDIKLI